MKESELGFYRTCGGYGGSTAGLASRRRYNKNQTFAIGSFLPDVHRPYVILRHIHSSLRLTQLPTVNT